MFNSNICHLLRTRHLTVDNTLHHRIENSLHGHQSFVERLDYSSELQGHRGCVNCLQWNKDGTLLASGSDDLDVRVWSPSQCESVACMHTGHTGNIFSVKFMPFSGDSLIVSCSEDKEVRLHDMSMFQTTRVWSCCSGRVKRLAISAHSPYLCWSASEDGCIRQYDTRETHRCIEEGSCRNVIVDLKRTCGTALGYTQCKCLDVNPIRHEQLAVGALDAYVRIYDMRMLSLSCQSSEVGTSPDPSCLAYFSPGHISQQYLCCRGTGFSSSGNGAACTYVSFSPYGSELLVNLSGDHVYLYDTVTLQPVLKYCVEEKGQEPYLASAPPSLYNHRQYQFDEGMEEEVVPLQVKALRDEGNKYYLDDCYTKAIQCYSSALDMCPQWHVLYSNRATVYLKRNWLGDRYEALKDTERALTLCPSHQKSLRRRVKCLKQLGWMNECEVFLEVYKKSYPQDRDFILQCQSDIKKLSENRNGHTPSDRRSFTHWETSRQHSAYDYQQRFVGHCNTHTDIKEAAFLGERGEYIAAGSDDGNVYIWEKRTGEIVRVLEGDESIVNCIQWHPRTAMMATSGIENVVRLWEPRALMTSGDDDSARSRCVADVAKVVQANQTRMKMDPFEDMLMRMGLRMMQNTGASQVTVSATTTTTTSQPYVVPNDHQRCNPS